MKTILIPDNNDSNDEIRIGRFADIRMDRWFKRSFGTEANKRLLHLRTALHRRTTARTTGGLLRKGHLQLLLRSPAAGQARMPLLRLPASLFHRHPGLLHPQGQREFIFLELPNCARALTENASVLDNFCYSLRNLPQLEDRPAPAEQSELLSRLFDSAEIATFSTEERNKYLNDMTTKRDIINQIAYAKKEGHAAGVAEGEVKGATAEKEAIARNLKELGLPPEQIAEL